jgi:lysophospholipase
MPFSQFSESSIEHAWRADLENFWRDKIAVGSFVGVSDVDIHYAYAKHPHPSACLVISSGRMESLLKYKEVIFDFYHEGYSIFIHDHRGQGLSGRMTENPHRGYVENFSDYVDDLKTFYESVVRANTSHHPVLLSHSMGAAVACLYVLRYREDFASMVMTAPMLGIRPAISDRFSHFLLRCHQFFSSEGKYGYFWGQRDYRASPFEQNRITTSVARYACIIHEYCSNPEIQLGGVTGQWLNEAINTMNRIEQHSHEISIPVKILQAGSDRIVDNHRQSRVAKRIPLGELQIIPGAQHELLMERDDIREKVLQTSHGFFQQHSR